MDRSDPAAGPADVATRLLAILLAPTAVAVLRLFAPLPLDGAAWLALTAVALAAAGSATGMLALLAAGLRERSAADLLRATALGTLTAGLALAGLRGVGAPEAVPDPALAVTALATAGLLLAARALDGSGLEVPGRPAPVAVTVFVVIEVALAAAIVLAPAADLAVVLFAVAAGVAAGSGSRQAWFPAGLLAAGFAALAVARAGSLEALAPLLVLGAAGVAFGSRSSGGVTRADPQPAWEPPHAPPTRPPSPLNDVDDEGNRLTRELRGTIEELLQARRTIELQRGEIARGAAVDPLTGVATRRAILDRLRIEAAEARRYHHSVAVVLLDLDDFAAVNHRHGMAVGDEVLREAALRLRLRVRAADALGRIGADSFVVILPHTDETGAAVFSDALRRRLTTRPIETSAGELALAVSIGVAFMRPGMTLSDEELLAAAEEALASARAAGGNRIAFDRAHGLVRLEERRTESSGG